MLFIHIERCRMFEDVLVPLHPGFNVNKSGRCFEIEPNDEFVDVFSDYRLYILALCGRNGVGKSTFLKLLSGRLSHESSYTICWIDHRGEIACNRKTKLKFLSKGLKLSAKVHHFSLSALCGNENLGGENSTKRSLLEIYSDSPSVFEFYGRPVFDGFHLDVDFEFHDLFDLEKRLSEHVGLNYFYNDLAGILDKHPLFLALASIANDSTFENLAGRWTNTDDVKFSDIIERLRDSESDSIEKEILELVYLNGEKSDLIKRSDDGSRTSRVVDPNWVFYEISEYRSVKDKLNELTRRVDRWVRAKLEEVENQLPSDSKLNLHLWDRRLDDLYSFRPFQRHHGRLFHFEDLSSGERYKIQLLFELAPKILPEHASWFFDDDLEEFLHPEWKRNLISRILESYRTLSARIGEVNDNDLYKERIATHIIATHSPFVLSDLPRACVLRFEMGAKGKTEVYRTEKSTFAGNIGELFHTEFFMESTIGEFARKAIKDAIEKLKIDPDPQTIESSRALFESVGDDVLRNLLLEKIRNAKN